MDILTRLLEGQKLACIDVGARGGMQNTWKPFAAHLEMDAFEPDPVACAKEQQANRPGEHWHAVGLAAATGKATLHVLERASSSGLYPPNLDVMRHYSRGNVGERARPVEIEVQGLGDFLAASPRPKPNLMKFDVQGAELPILKSMRDDQWSEVLGLQTEISFLPFYQGQPLFWDLDAYIRAQGLLFYDLLPVRIYRVHEGRDHHFLRKHLNLSSNRRDISARTVTGDAFYLRDPQSVLDSGNRVLLGKLAIVLMAYRFLDEVLWLAEEAGKRGIIDRQEEAALIETVRRRAPKPALRQRADRIGRWARRWSKKLNIGRARKIEYWLDRSWDF
jgi:FkbM family methyltransferase